MEDLAALKKTLERDPYLSPALSRAISSLSEHLTQKDRRALKNAMTNASENHWKKARKEIENLLRSDQEAEKMLADARKTQSFADAASDTEKMADQAQSLSSKLSELSQKTGKSPSKADLSALSQSLSALKKAMQKLQESIKNLPAAGSMPKGSSAQNLSLDAAQQSLNDLQKALSSGDYHNAAKIAEELARQTQEIESAISKMAQQSAFSQSLMRSAQKLMEGRQALERAIEGENAVYEKTANLEKNRLQKKIEAQKEMLKELARMQGVLLSSASDQGNAFPPGILGWMKDIKNDFDSGHAGGADRLLSLVSASLRGINSWRPKPSYDYFARGEDQIRKLLKTGVRSPSADQKESLSAGQYQASVRSETELAQNELKKLELTVPDFPGDAVSDLGKAQDEQRNAESSLNGADSESALSEEAGALSRLNHGLHSLDQTLKAQSSLASGLMPGAGAQGSTLQILSGDSSGSMGANIGLVPLPSPQNYQPLKKLRKELEKSLQEKSPQRYENLIKSYFRRIAQ